MRRCVGGGASWSVDQSVDRRSGWVGVWVKGDRRERGKKEGVPAEGVYIGIGTDGRKPQKAESVRRLGVTE